MGAGRDSRRDFLRRAGGAATALLVGTRGAASGDLDTRHPPRSAGGREPEAPEDPGGAGAARLRVSCSSLAWSDRSWEAALDALREDGFRLVELAMFEGWTHVDPSSLDGPEAHGRAVRAACERRGVEPVAVHANFRPEGAPEGFPGFTTDDDGLRDRMVEHAGRVLRCARAAGIPFVNVQPGRPVEGCSLEQGVAAAAKGLRSLVERAKELGRTLGFENHTGSIGESPEGVRRILEAVPGLTVDLDLSHCVAMRWTPEDARPFLDRVGHVAVRNAKPGEYALPVGEEGLAFELGPWLRLLREGGVEACVACEYFRPEDREQNVALRRVLEGAGLAAG